MLKRELLVWLLAIDLSYTFTSFQRHFSNGFLVAEILSKLFPKTVYLQSFDNVSRVELKRKNWEFIVRLMARNDVMLPEMESEEFIEDMVQCNKQGEKNVFKLLAFLKAIWEQTPESL